MDPDGILKGSAINDLKNKTIINIGKKDQWKKSLSTLHAQDIVKIFGETMKKFGYLN